MRSGSSGAGSMVASKPNLSANPGLTIVIPLKILAHWDGTGCIHKSGILNYASVHMYITSSIRYLPLRRQPCFSCTRYSLQPAYPGLTSLIVAVARYTSFLMVRHPKPRSHRHACNPAVLLECRGSHSAHVALVVEPTICTTAATSVTSFPFFLFLFRCIFGQIPLPARFSHLCTGLRLHHDGDCDGGTDRAVFSTDRLDNDHPCLDRLVGFHDVLRICYGHGLDDVNGGPARARRCVHCL